MVHNWIVELGQVEEGYGNSIWIGISDRIEEGNFVFLSSNFTPPFMNFEKNPSGGWSPEPNGGRRENCVDFFHNRECIRGKWNDAECRSNLQFVCEKPLIQ